MFQLLGSARDYMQRAMRKVLLKAIMAFAIVEILGTGLGASLVLQISGNWPTTDLWLAIIGISTAAASAADHLVAAWAFRRALKVAPVALATTVFTAVVQPDLFGRVRKFLHR